MVVGETPQFLYIDITKRKDVIMGWYYGNTTSKREYIKELTQDRENDIVSIKYITYCIRGNCVWSVIERTAKETNSTFRFISLDILHKLDGYWGHKPLDEFCGPAYYSCPKGYLKLAPYNEKFDGNGYAKNCRETV